jgi:type II secretion system protein H
MNAAETMRSGGRSLKSGVGVAVRAKARAGFSMVEMLGVILVMALIATLVSINWRAILPKTELHAAIRTIAATLQGVRSEAIARNQVYQVQYDIEKNRYRVITPFRVGGGLAASNEDRHTLEWNQLPASVSFRTITVDGVEYQKGMVFVRFDALGTASGHTILLVQSPYETLYTIEVQGLLGLIDGHEGLFTRALPKESDFK